MWWLLLGIPLSWKKGATFEKGGVHRWIGIDYSVEGRMAVMRLPPAFLQDLAAQLLPLCQIRGTIALADLDVIIGRAARVAHAVPHARPFVCLLYTSDAADE